MKGLNAFLLAATISLAFIVVGMSHALMVNPPYSIASNKNENLHLSEKGGSGALTSAGPNKEKSYSQNERTEDGTEYWPTLFGLHLKITDSLLALFTLGLLVFTGLLWKSTDKLWRVTMRTIQISHQEYISTHRPRIILRLFELIGTEHEGPIRIGYRVINAGESTAHLMSINATILYAHTTLPATPPYDTSRTDHFTHTLMESGQFMDREATTSTDINEFEAVFLDGTALMVFGFVTYCDDNGIVRQMGFGRSHVGNGHFRSIDSEEYVYND